jgi:hypothetical protein
LDKIITDRHLKELTKNNRLEIMLKFINKTEIYLQFELPIMKSVLKIANHLQLLNITESDEESNEESLTCNNINFFTIKIRFFTIIFGRAFFT